MANFVNLHAPSREKLSRLANGDREVIRAFEQLFECVDDLATRLEAAEDTIAANHP